LQPRPHWKPTHGARPLPYRQCRADGLEASRSNVDARRALLARLVLEHRLGTQDPLAPSTKDWEGGAASLLFEDRKIELSEISALLA
jgi:hypothetical protein